MRDILAALLRSRGYEHNDAADPRDRFWYSRELGVRPLLVCIAHEMNRDLAREHDNRPVFQYDAYQVSLAYPVGADA